MPDFSESRTQYSNESHTQVNNLNEQIVQEFTNLRDSIHIDMDLDTIGENIIVKIFEKVDGTNYTQVRDALFDPTYVTGDFDDDIKIVEVDLNGGGQDMKLTLQSVVLEGSNVIVPFTFSIFSRP